MVFVAVDDHLEKKAALGGRLWGIIPPLPPQAISPPQKKIIHVFPNLELASLVMSMAINLCPIAQF